MHYLNGDLRMRTIDKDFKNLVIQDPEDAFSSGFVMALLLVGVALKFAGIIP